MNSDRAIFVEFVVNGTVGPILKKILMHIHCITHATALEVEMAKRMRFVYCGCLFFFFFNNTILIMQFKNTSCITYSIKCCRNVA